MTLAELNIDRPNGFIVATTIVILQTILAFIVFTPAFRFGLVAAMKTKVSLVFLLLCSLAIPNVVSAETDEQALRQLPKTYCDAWAKHDGHQLAQMMAEDVDYVNVGALWLRGRSDFEKYHSRY